MMTGEADGRSLGEPLAGQVAVVTGGGSGIGEAICRRLADDGASVVVADIDGDAAALTLGAAGGRGIVCTADVSCSTDVDGVLDHALTTFGTVDVWVNNAGVMATEGYTAGIRARAARRRTGDGDAPPVGALVAVDDDEWRRMMAVNVDGVFFGMRAAARHMSARRTGSIINVASICGLVGCELSPHYSTAKAAIVGLTRAVAKELIEEGIRVNAIAPGFIDTAMVRSSGDGFVAALERQSPIGRLGTPAEVASTASFLAGPGSTFFVGQVLSPNGGVVTA